MLTDPGRCVDRDHVSVDQHGDAVTTGKDRIEIVGHEKDGEVKTSFELHDQLIEPGRRSGA